MYQSGNTEEDSDREVPALNDDSAVSSFLLVDEKEKIMVIVNMQSQRVLTIQHIAIIVIIKGAPLYTDSIYPCRYLEEMSSCTILDVGEIQKSKLCLYLATREMENPTR